MLQRGSSRKQKTDAPVDTGTSILSLGCLLMAVNYGHKRAKINWVKHVTDCDLFVPII